MSELVDPLSSKARPKTRKALLGTNKLHSQYDTLFRLAVEALLCLFDGCCVSQMDGPGSKKGGVGRSRWVGGSCLR